MATPIPAPDWVTVAGGGWVAPYAAGTDRLPAVVRPTGLARSPAEGPRKVQTSLNGCGVRALRLGYHVCVRHVRAGELAEHIGRIHTVAGDQLAGT
ncbi:hypothetical protein M3B11_07775 [Brevibacterium sp. p3-SID960]|uniref:hypothetical protein n=1 Tax=Brevibacterium sp. p3-SID960 TaxID=2916063 RepID=UPI0021A40EC3|nr:hypothetical protein [Brevibacterium sp. p3-SID960]MCT1690854.1 hypothetical protein [Brevibacterium sp. p3-SID960]